MFKFKVSYVALAAALSSSVVYADPSSYTQMLLILKRLMPQASRITYIANSTSALTALF